MPLLSKRQAAPPTPLIQRHGDQVEIAGIALACRPADAPACPPASLPPHYCYDQPTSETLLHVAHAAAYDDTCALEGDPGTSKTSVVQVLAALLGQPLIRVNLSGSTDAGDLVGRFVPAEGGGWRFQDGLLITAMRQGCWILKDEMNLADPQVVERVNPVLERGRSLTLYEHDGAEIVGHRELRIFGTMNPADHAGRSPQSPAFRDRWATYRHTRRPGELDYQAYAHFMITGEQPIVDLGGRRYRGPKAAPRLTNLARLPVIEEFLVPFARFQVSVERAAADAGQGPALGQGRREAYGFSRRCFTWALEDFDRRAGGIGRSRGDACAAAWAAIWHYHVGRVVEADRATVVDLANASGLFPDRWRAPS